MIFMWGKKWVFSLFSCMFGCSFFYLEFEELKDDNKKLEKELAEIREQMELISADLIQKLKDNNV